MRPQKVIRTLRAGLAEASTLFPILFGVLVIVMNLVSDIVAAIVDPRIKFGGVAE